MPYPGDALTWRCLHLATPHPDDTLSGQHVDFPPWAPWMGPTICLTLTLILSLVNAWGRDGTTQDTYNEPNRIANKTQTT